MEQQLYSQLYNLEPINKFENILDVLFNVRQLCPYWLYHNLPTEDISHPEYFHRIQSFMEDLVGKLDEISVDYAQNLPLIQRFKALIRSPIQVHRCFRDILFSEQTGIPLSFKDEEISGQFEAIERQTELIQTILGEWICNINVQRHWTNEGVPIDCVQQYGQLVSETTAIIESLCRMKSMIVVDRLARWKREQARSQAPVLLSKLDLFQFWIERWVFFIAEIRSCIESIKSSIYNTSLGTPENFDKLGAISNNLTELYHFVLASAWIVEKQPVQVMKTNTK